MLDQDLHLSHVPLPDPITGLCCNEVKTENAYEVTSLMIPKLQIHCEVCGHVIFSLLTL